MKRFALVLGAALLGVSGCAMFGDKTVEIAPYDVITSAADAKIDVRHYPQMILVSTPIGDDGRNDAFRRLFAYISGDNVAAQGIEMTAPVFMDDAPKVEGENELENGVEIPMTAPVFMDMGSNGATDAQADEMMSFVMPDDFTLDNTPAPTHPDVTVREVTDYDVAAIIFNGRLSDGNVAKHRKILEQWITDNGYVVTGDVKMAGYNAPFVLPHLRRNEVLIPVQKK